MSILRNRKDESSEKDWNRKTKKLTTKRSKEEEDSKISVGSSDQEVIKAGSDDDESVEDYEDDEDYGEDEEEDEEEDEVDFIKSLNRKKNGKPSNLKKLKLFGDQDHLDDQNDGEEDEEEEEEEEDDDDDESDEDGYQKSEKTKKRKRRAKSPTSFGLMLSRAIEASETSNAIGPSTTLNKSIRSAQKLAKEQSRLELMKKRLNAKRYERQERGHIKDVIGGWTPRPAIPFSEWLIIKNAAGEPSSSVSDRGSGLKSSNEGRGDDKFSNLDFVGGASHERTLRRLAQTGVVKLFNAIRAAQDVSEADPNMIEPVNLSGAQKRKLKKLLGNKEAGEGNGNRRTRSAAEAAAADDDDDDAAEGDQKGLGNGGEILGNSSLKKKPNVLGSRGKEEALANLSKASFLELIKSGGSKRTTT